jgi:hypothetical protein
MDPNILHLNDHPDRSTTADHLGGYFPEVRFLEPAAFGFFEGG